MSAQHTPTPWVAHTSPNCWRIHGPHGEVIAGGTAWGIPDLTPEALANARLMAEAPELLRCLEEIISTPWLGGKGGMIRARQAIARVKGLPVPQIGDASSSPIPSFLTKEAA